MLESCNPCIQASGHRGGRLRPSDNVESKSERPIYSRQKLVRQHRRDQVGNGQETYEREPTPIPPTYFSASIASMASMEHIERGQPSNLEAGWSLRLTGNAVNAAAAGNALKHTRK